MRKSFLLALGIMLTLCAPLHAQVAVSGSLVEDVSGVPLFSGQWCAGATCLTVTSGAFSGSVTAGTYTVTVKNASSVVILSVSNITIGGSTYNWNQYTVPYGATFSGNGQPYLACQLAASYTQNDSTPTAGAIWLCVAQSGQLVWALQGPPTPAGPGITSGLGVPTLLAVVPTIFVRTDVPQQYITQGATGAISSTWFLVGTGAGCSPNTIASGCTGATTAPGALLSLGAQAALDTTTPEQYGAVHDAVEVTDANWTQGSTTITTTSSGKFTSTAVDAGKIIVIQGAGQVEIANQFSKNQAGAIRPTALWSTIVSVTNSNTVTIANAPPNQTGTVMSVTYVSGASAPTGAEASTCTLTLPNGGTATVTLSAINTLSTNWPASITTLDTGEATAPTTATISNGTATCPSGTVTISTTLGAGSGSNVWAAFGTNDHAAVASALSAITTAGKGHLHFADGQEYMLGSTSGVSVLQVPSNTLIDGKASVICAPSTPHTAGTNDRCFNIQGSVLTCASGSYSTCPGTVSSVAVGATSIPLANSSDATLAATEPWVIAFEMYSGGQASYFDAYQTAGSSGSNVLLKTGTRMAFPCSEAVVVGSTGCAIYIVSSWDSNVQINDLTLVGPNLQDPNGTHRSVSMIYSLFAQNLSLRNLTGYCVSSECIYGQFNKGMTFDGVAMKTEADHMELASVVDLKITNSEFSKGAYPINGNAAACYGSASNTGILLDEAVGFFSLDGDTFNSSCGVGIAMQQGTHDGSIKNTNLGFNQVILAPFNCGGLEAIGSYNVTVSGLTAAGCGGNAASDGIIFESSGSPAITTANNNVYGNSVQNFITPYSVGALDACTYNSSGVLTSCNAISAPQAILGATTTAYESIPAISTPGSPTNGISGWQIGNCTSTTPCSWLGTVASNGGSAQAFNVVPNGFESWVSPDSSDINSILFQGINGLFFYYAGTPGTCPSTGTNTFATCFPNNPFSISTSTGVTSIAHAFLSELQFNGGSSPTLLNGGSQGTPGQFYESQGSSTSIWGNPAIVNTCGVTSTCANTAQTVPRIVWGGPVALSGGTLVVGSMAAWTSTTSFQCRAWDVTTPANTVSCANTSTSSITLTGTGTDSVSYFLVGN